MTKQIQQELAEYRTLLTSEEKEAFWERIHATDSQLTEEERLLINEVILEDLQATISKTKDFLNQGRLVKSIS